MTKKDLPSYAESRIETEDPKINELLGEIADACMRLEHMGAEMDKSRAELENELGRNPANQEKLGALRDRIDALMGQIVEIENKEMPALMRLFQELGREKAIESGLAKKAQEKTAGATRTGELDIGSEPTASEDGESPWNVD